MKAKVYFSREITPEKVVALYRAVGCELPGKVAVKLHSGEQGNQNFLGPDLWRPGRPGWWSHPPPTRASATPPRSTAAR